MLPAVLAGMADLFQKEGRYGEAEAAMRRALDIRVKSFGESGRLTQKSIKALADLYTAWGRPAQAASYTARLKPAAPPKP
jgi:Tfp pilus assembly protein PilF